jgi:O-antigen ligase
LSIVIIAGFLVYCGRSKPELTALAGILAVAAAFLLWIGPEKVIERVGTLSQGQGTPSLAVRIEAWRHSLALIAHHLGAGTGLGTFAYSFMRYAPPGRYWWNIAHNEYIELICDTGIAGGAIFLVGLTAWLLLIWKPGIVRGHRGRYEFAGIVAGLAALLVHSSVTSNLQIPANSLLLVVLGGALLGIVMRRQSNVSRDVDERDQRPLRSPDEAS